MVHVYIFFEEFITHHAHVTSENVLQRIVMMSLTEYTLLYSHFQNSCFVMIMWFLQPLASYNCKSLCSSLDYRPLIIVNEMTLVGVWSCAALTGDKQFCYRLRNRHRFKGVNVSGS